MDRLGSRIAIYSSFLTVTFLNVCCQKASFLAVGQTAAFTSTVYTGDPNSGPQLVDGFFQIEDHSWRWTTQRFAVVLRTPWRNGEQSAALLAEITVPAAQIARLKRLTLAASVGHTSFLPETYSHPGSFIYEREVPASLLHDQEVRIDFTLDRVSEPGSQDQRRLGVIVSSIRLEPQ